MFVGLRLTKSRTPSNFNIWLGGNDMKRENSFKWRCNNKPVRKGAPWYRGNPDNKDMRRKNADCMSFVYVQCRDRKCRAKPRTMYQWNDELCTEPKYPLCIHNSCPCGKGEELYA